ncbi:MAG: SCP2 sterol-binding domain-containing protein [Gammaproteobacteria bacterium]|nr:SCP2 sterol-binding domain-containing protein [Gammaproteobacteria bacterium]
MNIPQPVHIRALEGALNRYLNLDPDTPSRFAALSGKVIAVELEGLERTIYLAPEPDGVRILADYAGVPDATLRGAPWALLRMGSLQSDSREARAALALGEIRISGDVELGQRFKQILDAVEIDWEEHLAGFVGDLLAHKLGNAARAVQGWGRQAAARLGQDFAEYQQEEAYNLPRPDDVRNFIGAVDTLRDDVERLEQRVARLRRRLEAATDKKT